MVKVLEPGATIGILGAGQLGKMMAQSAQKMGYHVAMYDEGENSCGYAVADRHVVGSYSDHDKVLAFGQSVDVLTYEFENIDGPLLEKIEAQTYLPQGTKLLLNSQHRVMEKQWLNTIGAQTVAYYPINEASDFETAINEIGLPAVLKTSRFGYDGKGQVVIHSEADLEAEKATIDRIISGPAILEVFMPFAYEASVMVSRDLYGDIEILPASINRHRNGILYAGIVGGEIPQEIYKQIQSTAIAIAREGELIGVCGVEFFITSDGRALVNEIAPRPHNSGHYSIEALNASQYDEHILALTGHHLIAPRLYEPALMINILGQHIPYVQKAQKAFPEAIFHIYGKDEPKRQRKMGHFTLTDLNYTSLLDILDNHPLIQQWEQLF
ncbi:MAG: 5-(carboxyamino)imidazole ribonucleotide synthase [Aerococcus sp.]|nr:5-(carboxyamino)imidazole ribonucleotide synthase [Aerococcus sp.]